MVGKGLRRFKWSKGSVLLAVLVVSTILWMSLASVLSYMGDARRMEIRRIENDRALYVAEAGLAQGLSWFATRQIPPQNDTTMDSDDVVNPEDNTYDLEVKFYPQSDGIRDFWTVVSTATYNSGESNEFNRRVQATLVRENFAKYEYFVHYGPTWTNGYLHFYGFNKVYFGPVHSNSGVGLWPNLWFVDEFTTAVSGDPPARVYNNYSSYVSGVYRKNDANNYVNIMKYYNDTYKHEPKFYEGWRVLEDEISLPDISDPRAQKLQTEAGLILPGPDYPIYNTSEGPNFAIELIDPTAANDDGQISIKQYLGKDNDDNPIYGPEVIKNIADVNNAMVVYGDIVSLKGTLDGRLTIGGFRKNSAQQDGTGRIKITGSLEYESRKNYETNYGEPFAYSDAPDLYTNSGADVNLNFIEDLQEQVMRLDDILGLVSEADVTLPEYDLDGNRIGDGYDTPILLDAIVMATGNSTSNSRDGSYYPENMHNRPVGSAHRLGGVIQNEAGSWALYSSGNHTAGR